VPESRIFASLWEDRYEGRGGGEGGNSKGIRPLGRGKKTIVRWGKKKEKENHNQPEWTKKQAVQYLDFRPKPPLQEKTTRCEESKTASLLNPEKKKEKGIKNAH